MCVYAGNRHCIEKLLALNQDQSEADLLFATTRSGWMCNRACRSNLRSHGPYLRTVESDAWHLMPPRGHPPAPLVLVCRPIHNVCVKHSPAYARASELVPRLLKLMSERSGTGVGEGKLVLDRPKGFKEENKCDMELLRAVTRPEPEAPPAAASE